MRATKGTAASSLVANRPSPFSPASPSSSARACEIRVRGRRGAPRTRRLPRLASWRAAAGERWERHWLGDAVETFFRREDAERFIEEVLGDDPELASYLRIKERELEAGGLN